MPISGLALTLSDDAVASARAVDALHRHDDITVGVREGHRLAIVVETDGSERDCEVWHWLNQLPGVSFVDVVCVHFADDQQHHAPESIVDGQGILT